MNTNHSKAHDLFLLLLNLSQLSDRDLVLRLFVQSIAGLWPKFSFGYAESRPANPDLAVEIATVRNAYGHIVVQGDSGALPHEELPLLHNAVGMLAVLLERHDYQKASEDRQTLLETEVDRRTQELRERNRALEREVRERERAEEALRESLLCQEEAVKAGRVGLWDWDLANNKVSYSAEWKRQIGYSDDEVGSGFEEWRDRLHPDDLDPTETDIQKMLEDNYSDFKTEFRFRHKNGSYIWILAQATIFRNKEGSAYRVLGSHVDITDRKQAEAALRRTEALLRTMLVNLPLDFWARDLDGRVIIQSDICRNIWGDLDKVQEDDRIPANTLARWKANNARALAGETVEGDCEYVLPSAERAYYHEIVAPIRDQGEVLGVMGVNVDLTGRFTMEEELRASMETAKAASRAKSEFLATMSHEIRTPLNGVLGMLQLAQTTDLTAEQAEYLETALQSGRSLLRVLSDVLDISRIEAGALTIVAEDFQPAEVFGPILNAYREQAQAKGLDFACTLAPGLPAFLHGDAGRIRQVAYNLVGNALKYTAKGEVQLEAFTLPAAGEPGDVRLHIVVSDTGIGVPENKVQDIFEAFTQVDGSYTRRYGGTGLGLTIVKRLVGLMGGTIEFCSRPGEGTDVLVVLPLRLGRAKAAAVPRPAAAPEPPREVRSLDVLLAEDDRVNRLTVRHMLTKAGHRVHEVENGAQAVAFLATNAVDCVLMDVQMPEMDGVEATRRIRAGEAGEAARTVPVIALTAHAMKGDREQFLAAGMDGYLAKPVDMAGLERMLSDMAALRTG